MLSGLMELYRRCCVAVGSGSAPPVVTVAVSGGVDSAVCLSLLRLLQHHFHFQQQRGLGLPFFEVHRGGIRWERRGAALRSNPAEYILRPPSPPPFLLRAVHMRNWSADAEDGVVDTERLRRSNNRREALRSSVDCLDRQEGDARELCRNLGIDLQIVDCSEAYWSRCFLPMLDSMSQRGLPLNPDVLCNTEVKFGQLLGILDSSTTFLATGHYAATRWVASRDTPLLCSPRGVEEASDSLNDQTYFLSQLVGSPRLCRALFPLGEVFRSKEEVRAFAREVHGVIPPQVAGKPTSTGLCFVGRRRWIEFASQYLPLEGNERERVRWCDDRGIEMTLEHAQSVVVGGVCYSQADQPLLLKTLTIGQKICFVITKSVIVFYVFAKDLSRRVVFIVPKADVERCNRVLMHTSCEVDGLVLDSYLWEGKEKPLGVFPMEVCVRHQLPYVAASLSIIEGDSKRKGIVKFKAPVRAVTPQQVAVFRRQDPETKHFVCMGSGTISNTWGAHVNR